MKDRSVNEYLDEYTDRVSTTISDFITGIVKHVTPKGKKPEEYKFVVTVDDLRDEHLSHTITRNGKVVGTVVYNNGRIEAICHCKPVL